MQKRHELVEHRWGHYHARCRGDLVIDPHAESQHDPDNPPCRRCEALIAIDARRDAERAADMIRAGDLR